MSTKKNKTIGTLPVISSLGELKAYRARLKAEADIALELLKDKSAITLKQNTAKVATAVAVPVALSALGKMGLDQITNHTMPTDDSPADWPDEIQRSWHAYQAKATHKWTAFLPMALKMGLAYLAKEKAQEEGLI